MNQSAPVTKSQCSLSKSPNRNQPIIAYFILVHRFPKQFKRLFKAIYNSENHYLIHIDSKSEKFVHLNIEEFLIDYPNTYVLESENVVWGAYSMVQSELNAIQYLLAKKIKWDFFINLSGQDFPLKSQNFIREFLGKNMDKSFIKIANQAEDRPDTMNRIENYYQESSNGLSGKMHRRAFMKDVTSYIGGQWMILTRNCCEFICNSPEVKKFEAFYRNTLIADESFFQTVLMNTSFEGTIVNDDKRAIIWLPDGDIKLRPKTLIAGDLNFLLKGENLFARKFDEKVDTSILDILESRISLDRSLHVSKGGESLNLPINTSERKKPLIDHKTQAALTVKRVALN